MQHVDTTAESVNDTLKPHPAAELFPPMDDAAFEELWRDIKQNGQREPITTYQGQVLDGLNRLAVCRNLGLAPLTVEWDGRGTPEDFVLSKNLHRRHLTTSQRAVVGARLATLVQGQQKTKAQNCASSQREAAECLKVSRRTIQHAAVVIAKGVPELVDAIQTGAIKASKAAELVVLSKERQKFIATAGKASGHLANQAANEIQRRRRAQQPKPVESKKPDIISPPDVSNLPLANPRQDEEFQLEALVFENEKLRQRLDELTAENTALKAQL